ncbi:hypothetical protein LIP_0939 [Limnochorda pilosa]|uniref:Uncharacterized protein n=1 Tax=Limnochorda pilosa TaxID=1555112 RepID=A0A0K2SI41_LIMPI|nr:hypothetical protein LIP_0939 [Limnochorda pilosa]
MPGHGWGSIDDPALLPAARDLEPGDIAREGRPAPDALTAGRELWVDPGMLRMGRRVNDDSLAFRVLGVRQGPAPRPEENGYKRRVST